MTTVPGTPVPVTILHRLALGVAPVDAVTGIPLDGLVVERELPAAAGPPRLTGADPTELWPPGAALEQNRSGRYRLRYGPRVGATVTVRLRDRRRRFVPRRLAVSLWPLGMVSAVDETPGAHPVPVADRVLRPWLWPGSGYLVPHGTTGIRGRVVRADGRPLRWPRVAAVPAGTGAPDGAGTVAFGRAHGDERGEFLLVVTGVGTAPPQTPGVVDVDLLIAARPAAAAGTGGSGDAGVVPLTDLPVEPAPVPGVPPPHPSEVDKMIVFGARAPDGYVTAPRVGPVRLTLGELLVPSVPYRLTV
jgi:hypothetical protein